ncbi:MAG TPA: SHOCT domain-containing protein [Gaiellaceae bacterium]
MLFANYNFASFLWDVLVIFAFVIWFWLLIVVFGDLFSRHDISGWGKTGWIILVVVLPYLGVFIYFIANGQSMGERAAARAQSQQAQMDDYVRTVAASDTSADQIAKGKQLLDSGTITQAEFDQLKAKALGT